MADVACKESTLKNSHEIGQGDGLRIASHEVGSTSLFRSLSRLTNAGDSILKRHPYLPQQRSKGRTRLPLTSRIVMGQLQREKDLPDFIHRAEPMAS